MRRRCGLSIVAAAIGTLSIACGRSGLERLTEARQLAADILVHFTKAADASNRAVMAETDEASAAYAAEARQARALVADRVSALGPILAGLGYSGERRVLEAFVSRFHRFMALHAQIVTLSRRNSNVRSLALTLNEKGRLTGACEESARQLRDALAARSSGTR